jgi:hypothetical protein
MNLSKRSGLTRIATKVPAGKKVGDVLSEAEVRNIYERKK